MKIATIMNVSYDTLITQLKAEDLHRRKATVYCVRLKKTSGSYGNLILLHYNLGKKDTVSREALKDALNRLHVFLVDEVGIKLPFPSLKQGSYFCSSTQLLYHKIHKVGRIFRGSFNKQNEKMRLSDFFLIGTQEEMLNTVYPLIASGTFQKKLSGLFPDSAFAFFDIISIVLNLNMVLSNAETRRILPHGKRTRIIYFD